PENVQGRARGVVDPRVKAVLAERPRTRADEIIEDSVRLGSGEGRQDLPCRRRNPGNRNKISRKWRPSSSGVGVARQGIVNLAATGNACRQILTQIAKAWRSAASVRGRIACTPNLVGRDGECPAHAVGLPRTLVIAEEEQLVF